MKLLVKIICIFILTISTIFISIDWYVDRMFQRVNVEQLVQEIDLMPIVESKIDHKYKKIIGKVSQTEEFQSIVYDYATSFILYLYNNHETYVISEEVETNLFKQYSDLFLAEYPQFSFLPTNMFVEFLVEKIDLNIYLPSFEELKSEIPSDYLHYLEIFKSENLKMKVITIMVISFILYVLITKNFTLIPLIVSLLITIFILGLFYKGYFIKYLPFSTFENALIWLFRELQVEIKYCIMCLIGCLCLEWGTYYAKKIFLF